MPTAGCLRASGSTFSRRHAHLTTPTPRSAQAWLPATDSEMPEHLAARVRARLAAVRAAGLWRELREPNGIDLASNDYLGLARDPRVVSAMADALRTFGAGSTGSRLLRGHRDIFGDIESRFAAFKRADRALYFSSGYLANLAAVTALAERGDVIYSDERNHASLIDAIRLSAAECVVFPHNDTAALESQITGRRATGQAFVVTESLFSMDGDEAPLGALADLCRIHGAMLLVDEAHAVGVRGQNGSGLIEEAGLSHSDVVSINAAGKALGAAGAFVAGPAWAIDYLIQRARPFLFSTAPPPAIAAAIGAALAIVDAEPER